MDITDKELDEMAKYNFKTVLQPAEIRAEEFDAEVEYPKPNELQLDIDSEQGFIQFHEIFKIARRMFVFLGDYRVIPSRSGEVGHCHIYLELEEDITDLERITLQCILGSDPARELFNFHRYKEKGESDSCFFNKKKENNLWDWENLYE